MFWIQAPPPREAGFHSHLANFLGWQLPEVQRFDGIVVPLYLESIFPMLFVEQKRGWSVIQGPFPTYFQIQDVGRRVVEFLMDLDAQRVRLKRRELQQELGRVMARWREHREALRQVLRAEKARVDGVPAEPTGQFALDRRLVVEVLVSGAWVDLTTAHRQAQERLDKLREAEIPKSGDDAERLEEELEVLRGRLEELRALRDVAYRELRREQTELAALQSRLAALRSDLQKNQDALKLKNLGSTLGVSAASGLCPTCHQEVSTELLPTTSVPAMGIEENIAFIQSQRKLYEAMQRSGEQRVAELEELFQAHSSELSQIRAQIRSAESTLLSASDAPSEAAIRERLVLEGAIETYAKLELLVAEAEDRLLEVANEYLMMIKEIEDLPRDELSSDDKSKVTMVSQLLQKQLLSYGFKSYPPANVTISVDNFRPIVEIETDIGKLEAELSFEMSASDAIRLKWAYLLSFLYLGQRSDTNHPGLLIFDEPGQQEVDTKSFSALLQWATMPPIASAQVILATSEAPEAWQAALEGRKVNVLRREGYILEQLE